MRDGHLCEEVERRIQVGESALNASGWFPTCVFFTLRAAFAASRAACGRSRAARLTAKTTAEGFPEGGDRRCLFRPVLVAQLRASWSRSATNSSGAAASSLSASFGTSTVIAMQPQRVVREGYYASRKMIAS